MSAEGVAGPGPVSLVLPAVAGMARVARLTASAVAALADLGVDDIDDVKIAVSEVVALLIEHGDRSNLSMRFEIHGRALAIEGAAAATRFSGNDDTVVLSTTVLDAVAGGHELAFIDGRILVRVVKHASDPT